LCAPRFSIVHDKVALRPTVAVTFCKVPLNLGSIFVESVFGVGEFKPETTFANWRLSSRRHYYNKRGGLCTEKNKREREKMKETNKVRDISRRHRNEVYSHRRLYTRGAYTVLGDYNASAQSPSQAPSQFN